MSGIIKDKKGETLPGVSVSIHGTTQGAITDLDGKFKIDNLAEGKYKLVISFVGYDTQIKEITIKAGEGASADFQILESAIGLNEMVVVGYGTTGTLGTHQRTSQKNDGKRLDSNLRDPIQVCKIPGLNGLIGA